MNNELGNYTGPYWSDGKLQTSVEFGESEAINGLDELSRLHDTVYAHYPDRAHREAADRWYAEECKKLTGMYPALAGRVVNYGNYAVNQAKQLASDVATYSFLPGIGGIFGAAKWVVNNIGNSQKMIDGTYLQKERKDILDLFERDPAKKKQLPVSTKVELGDVVPRSAKKEAAQVQPEKKGPTATIINNANTIQRQKEKFEAYNQLYKEALESNLNKGKTMHISQYLKPRKGRIADATLGRKRKSRKNKVVPS